MPGGRSWSDWGAWTSCSVSCGKGRTTRTRFGKMPDPVNGIRRTCASAVSVVVIRGVPRRAGEGEGGCRGQGQETSDCREAVCPRATTPATTRTRGLATSGTGLTLKDRNRGGRRRAWSVWGAWSGCSSSCQGGVRQRFRTCEGQRGDCFGTPTDNNVCGTERSSLTWMSLILNQLIC